MKKGILIVFFNDEKFIKKYNFKNILNQENTEFCLVNNGSSDKTLLYLQNIKEQTISELHILDIKKNKGITTAIKAGARYLFNCKDLKIIFHINSNLLFYMKDFKNRMDHLSKSEINETLKKSNKNKSKTLKKVYTIDNFLCF